MTVTLLPSNDTTPPNVFWASDSPGCGFVDFMWDGAGDNADGWFQLEFEIYEDGLFRGVWRDEAFEASFGRHTYQIRAVDRAGNRSEPSNEVVIESGAALLSHFGKMRRPVPMRRYGSRTYPARYDLSSALPMP